MTAYKEKVKNILNKLSKKLMTMKEIIIGKRKGTQGFNKPGEI